MNVTDLEEAFLNAECVIVDTAEVFRYNTNAKLIMWLCEAGGSLFAAGADQLRMLCTSMSKELKARHETFMQNKIKFPIDCEDARRVMDRLWKCMSEMSLELYENSYSQYAAVLKSLIKTWRQQSDQSIRHRSET